MATLEEAQYSSLTAHVGLSALISTRLYPGRLPQTPTLPAVSYRRVTRATVHNKPNDDLNTASVLIQYDVWAATYSAARAVAEQLKDAIGDFVNASDPQLYDSRVVDENEFPYEPDTALYGISVDALMVVQECL